MPAGVVQLESALVDWTADTTDGVRTRQWTLGASVLRFGLGSNSNPTRLDAVDPRHHPRRRHTSDRQRYRRRVARLQGPVDAADAPLALDLMPFVKLPLAKRPLGNRRLEGGVVAQVDIALADRWTMTLSPEGDWNADEDGHGHHLGVAGAVGLGFDVSDSLSAGLAVWGSATPTPAARSIRRSWPTKALFALVARPKLQFDIEADAGIGGAAPDLQLIAGVSIRR